MPRKKIDFRRSPYIDAQHLARRSEIMKRIHGIRGPRTKTPINSVYVTRIVKEFSEAFPKTEQGIKSMAQSLMRNVKFVREKPSIADAHYMVQTAHDIILTKKIPVVFDGGEPAWGCNAMAIAFAACLKAKGVKYGFVRTTSRWYQANPSGVPHSVVYFRLGNKRFVADLFPKHPLVSQVGQELRERIGKLREHGLWVEGASPEAIGIRSIGDFDRHVKG
ncbi:MAG: hypothetical protein JW772_00205 [Candidatus Diapherotrites archaeon]|nr:hypothetical protein [Candidatus Diapherotrites archaeon]